MSRRGFGFWALQGPGWLLTVYLLVAQGIPAVDYDLGIAMGTQEPAATVTEVGTAFWWGFAFADLVLYIPLLAAGLVGHLMVRGWGRVALSAALGVTAYWPIVALATVAAARDAPGWSLPKEQEYWIVLPLIAVWALWGLWHVATQSGRAGR